jgi:8-amino-7-oxononanoate synthase
MRAASRACCPPQHAPTCARLQPMTTPSDTTTENRWLARWRDVNSDIARLQFTHRMADAVIEEQCGRDVRIGDHWLADFASCNYLGFDLDEEIIGAVPEYLARWGTHPSWSRIIASPVLYEEIEEQLADLCGTQDALALPTITHIHFSVLPVIAAGGTVFLDSRAHKTVLDGATAARATGADVKNIGHNNLARLQARLEAGDWKRPGVIALDGVNSMTGNLPDLVAYAALAREHDAILYVDDAHGFGVIGDRGPDELSPYGASGNGIVRYLGESYDNVIFIGALSKAYSSLMAFLAVPTELKTLLKSTAPPYVYSGPSPVASLATVLEGLRVNRERGDVVRRTLHARTKRILDCIDELQLDAVNDSGLPIIQVPLEDPERVSEVGDLLYDRGLYVTMCPYPIVPRREAGFRIQVTAANGEEHIDRMVDALTELQDLLRRRPDDVAAKPRFSRPGSA